MPHAIKITTEEMDEFLIPKGFKKITVEGTTELVYGKRVDAKGFQLSLRVYSSLSVYNDQSRAVGEDAIRVILFSRNKDKIVKVAGLKRVHRVENWRKNLQERLDSWTKISFDKCPSCGNIMVPRKGKNGNFLGCSNYPNCKETKCLN